MFVGSLGYDTPELSFTRPRLRSAGQGASRVKRYDTPFVPGVETQGTVHTW